ncbi:hypothetical protein RFI_07188 [Reticulomyxa filosa]|uniref:Uncharacterized protein n=1 Tax=Reticulomyxa filosa TaxID=46433 RepID=X6NXE3_RETFI|nr:hypothetical protein RFI_07188 [Reticulomyxa filosa]|eukprot:ETO29932.1 hypothetical protein RFI_07188 [Reticulomyxa filosa]
MNHYFLLSNDFSVEEKVFPFYKKLLLDITNVVLALFFKQPNKANFYSMELVVESSFTNALLCKVQQLPKKKRNNQYKSNTRKTTIHSKKRLMLYIYLHSQERHQFFCCFIQFDSEKQSITKLVMIEFGMKLKSFSFSKLSSMGKMYDTKNKKINEKPQINYIHNQRDDIWHVSFQ